MKRMAEINASMRMSRSGCGIIKTDKNEYIKDSPMRRELLTMLDTCSIFSGCTELPWLIEAEQFYMVSYRAGNVIYERECFERALGVIIRGGATIYKDNGGCPVIIGELAPGSSFGAAALFKEQSRYASRIVAGYGETLVAYIPEELMKALMDKSTGTALSYIEFLSDRIRYLNGRLDLYTASSAEERLLAYLSTCPLGRTANMLKLSKELDMGRATLYRTLDRLVAQGLIKKENREIILIADNEGKERVKK